MMVLTAAGLGRRFRLNERRRTVMALAGSLGARGQSVSVCALVQAREAVCACGLV